MQKTLVCFLLISSMIGLSQNDSPIIFEVSAVCETVPVESPDDGADDPCIWVPEDDSQGTIIVGTDKKFGLETYDLRGQKLSRYGFGNINNVDVNPDFFAPNQDGIIESALVVGTNRSTHSIDFYKLNRQGSLTLIHREILGPEMGDVYGLCVFRHNNSNYFVASDKDGRIYKATYHASVGNHRVEVVQRALFKLGSTVEGLVADTFHQVLYIAEEDKGIWAYPLVDNNNQPRLIVPTDPTLMVSDIEGLTLYDKGNGRGYLLCSIQGANRYGVINRQDAQLLGVFSIVASPEIDGAQETDGIDVTSKALPDFPKGIFVVQDGVNEAEKQNFKFVNWADIESKLNH